MAGLRQIQLKKMWSMYAKKHLMHYSYSLQIHGYFHMNVSYKLNSAPHSFPYTVAFIKNNIGVYVSPIKAIHNTPDFTLYMSTSIDINHTERISIHPQLIRLTSECIRI